MILSWWNRLGWLLEGLTDRILLWDHRTLISISSSKVLRRLDGLLLLASYLGDGYLWGLFGVWLIFLGGREERTNVLVGLAVAVVQLSLVKLLKLVFARERPPVLVPVRRVFILDSHAFPSGHATLAFGMATLTLRLYPEWIGLVCLVYVLATIIAISRVYLREHYPLDVIGGVILGAASAWFLGPVFKTAIVWR